MMKFIIFYRIWDADIAVEAEMEKIVIQVTSSDEDTDTATECSDYSTQNQQTKWTKSLVAT